MKQPFDKKRKERGQAAIEFLVVMLVVFFFLFFFLSLSVLLMVSSYVDYATFMAARTYKAGEKTHDTQRNYARQVFNAYMNKIDGIVRNYRIEFVATDPENQQTAGVFATYEMDLFYMPPFFASQVFPNSAITLHSEAHLGRDPSFEDCKGFFSEFSRRLGLGLEGHPLLGQMVDNGC